MPGSELHALLIGIDRYRRDGRPAVDLYPDLRGAVRDVLRFEEFLRERGLSARIRKLTASLEGSEDAAAPTYENVMTAMQELRREARPGDRVLIAFSGHGGRVPTLCPEVKGAEGIDEALVPLDVGDPGTRYVRDVELAFLLRRMTADGLLVTLVLDCCHAGGTTRETGVRGTGRIDRTDRPGESLAAGAEELARTWRSLARRRRALAPASGWLPDPRGYVLLAACRAHERAFEGWFDAGGPGGALTWALLDAARHLGSDVTCRELHERVFDQVRQWNEGQTPQLEGDADRIFLGTGERVPAAGRPRYSATPAALRWLDNPGSYLTERFRLVLYRLPAGFDPDRTWGGALRRLVEHLKPLAGAATVRVGDWLCLVLTNDSLQPLNVAAFDHQPGGGVSRVYPAPGIGESELLMAGARELLPLEARLAGGLQSGTDVIQAVAAADAAFFHRLDSANPPGGWDWTVATIEVRLVRE